MDNPAVSKELETLFREREKALRFPEALENEFSAYYTNKFVEHIRNALIAGGFMFFISAVIQLFFFEETRHILLNRYLIVGTGILFFILIAQIRRFEAFHQLIAFCSAATLSLGIMAANYNIPELNREIYGYGILIIMIYALCFSRMLFIGAVAFTGLNGIAINIFLYLEGIKSIYIYLGENFIFASAALLLLTNNFIMEYSQRQEFLQSRMIDIERSRIKNLNDHLNIVAHEDPMSGLANFRRFEEVFHAQWIHAIRHQYPLSILMIDFDKFKSLNDTYGHQAGDEALQKIGDCLKKFARRGDDIAARYGGDEFVLLLNDTDGVAAAEMAEAIRESVENLKIPNKNSGIKSTVTITIGVASMIPQRADTPELLLKLADESLFIAKESGRNSVGFEGKLLNNPNPISFTPRAMESTQILDIPITNESADLTPD